MKKIGKQAFEKCKKLSSVTFKGKKAPTIGKAAFKGIKKKCSGCGQYEKKSGEKITESHENSSTFCKDHLQEKNNRSFLGGIKSMP